MKYLATSRRLASVVAGAALAVLAGCDNPAGLETSRAVQEPSEALAAVAAPTVSGGRLVFSSPSHAESYVGTLGTGASSLATKEATFSGFTSLRAYLAANDGETALASDSVVRDQFPVGDPFLSILNEDGEVRIGGDVWKVTRDHVYRVAATDAAALSAAVPTLRTSPDDASYARSSVQIESHPVETTYVPMSDQPTTAVASLAPSYAVTVGSGYSHLSPACVVAGYNQNYRMEGVVFISNYWFYSEAGVKTRWQKKESYWFFWHKWKNRSQSGLLEHTFDATTWTSDPIGGHTSPVRRQGTWWVNSGSEAYTQVRYRFGIGLRMYGTIYASHRVANSGANGSCETYVERR